VAVSQRKQLGAWYTPPALVRAVVAQAVGPRARRVLDPACGDGRFLAAAAQAIGPAARLTGVDVDLPTVERARRDPALAELGEWVHGDALAMDWTGRAFDVVVGNPPFLSQLAVATTRGGSSRFGGGPYADAAAEFLALAVQLVGPGGRVGLVLPQSLLAARDAATIRAAVSTRAALRWMWWSPTLMFDANVRTWAGVWEVGAEQGQVQREFGPSFEVLRPIAMPSVWSGLIADASRPPAEGERTLGDVAVFTADFRDQYYGLVGAVADDADGPPLVTSGLIEPDRCLWGERPVRFAKQRFTAPRVDLALLSPSMQTWARRRLVPKILIANQTRTIEAVHDERGEWLPGVPVITCTSDQPGEVLRVLQSPAATDWVRYHAAGSGLSAGTIRLTARLLASIPLP